MKILEAFGEPISYGGQESFVVNLIQHMDLDGFQLDFLTPYYCNNNYYCNIARNFGGKIYVLGENFQPGKSRFNINKGINNFFKINHYDVVHIHSGSISILGIIAYYAKKNGVKKVIVHSHSSIEKKSLRNFILKICCSVFLKKNVNFYCACSQAAGSAKFIKHIQQKNLLIIKNGIDLDKFMYDETKRRELRVKLKIDENCLVIGHVGRFSYEKNHDFLIDVFYEIVKQLNNVKLILVGKGPTENMIKRKVKKFGLESKVIFYGEIKNVCNCLQIMDVFVFPSKFEGLGIACIEAQATGLNCFVSDKCPADLKITDLTHFLPLAIGATNWAENIIRQGKHKRRWSRTDELLKAGYDIDTTAKFIRNLYLK